MGSATLIPASRTVWRRKPLGAGEGGRVAAALELLEAVVDPVVEQVLVRLGPHRHPRPRRRRRAPAVLAGQPAAGERAEGGEPEPVGGAERQDLGFGLAVEQR